MFEKLEIAGPKRNYRHGYKTQGKPEPEYVAWRNARSRCHNPLNNRYEHYGARGITMCVEWRSSFIAFLEEMGRRPSPNHTLERINNDIGYQPGNCKWATRSEQARNRSTNRFLSINGETKPTACWSDEFGITQSLIHSRLKRGWSEEAAVLTPVRGAARKDDGEFHNVTIHKTLPEWR